MSNDGILDLPVMQVHADFVACAYQKLRLILQRLLPAKFNNVTCLSSRACPHSTGMLLILWSTAMMFAVGTICRDG